MIWIPLLLLLLWDYKFGDPKSDPRAWVIERKEGTGAFIIIGRPDAGVSQYDDEATTPGHTYTYRVAGVNYDDKGTALQGPYSAEVTATEKPPRLPAAPSNQTIQITLRPPTTTLPTDLVAFKESSDSVRGEWTPPTDPAVSRVHVEAQLNGGDWNGYTSALPPSTSRYVIGGLSAGTWRLRLRLLSGVPGSIKLLGLSNESNPVTLP